MTTSGIAETTENEDKLPMGATYPVKPVVRQEKKVSIEKMCDLQPHEPLHYQDNNHHLLLLSPHLFSHILILVFISSVLCMFEYLVVLWVADFCQTWTVVLSESGNFLFLPKASHTPLVWSALCGKSDDCGIVWEFQNYWETQETVCVHCSFQGVSNGKFLWEEGLRN